MITTNRHSKIRQSKHDFSANATIAGFLNKAKVINPELLKPGQSFTINPGTGVFKAVKTYKTSLRAQLVGGHSNRIANYDGTYTIYYHSAKFYTTTHQPNPHEFTN